MAIRFSFRKPFLTVLLACCQYAVVSEAYAEQNAMFKDASDGVAFSYPASWEKKKQRTGQFRIMVGGKSPLSGNCMLSTKANQMLAQYTDAELMSSTTAKDIENGARQAGVEIQIVSFKQTKIGNRPALLYESTSHYQSLDFKTPLRTIAGTIKVKDKLYELGCTAHPDVAAIERDTYLNVIGSLTIRFD
jgi:hypothetical protein